MKKTFLLFGLLAFFAYKNQAQTTVTIPDTNFKNYLINNISINTNSDNEIQVSEANSYTGTIDCFNLSINDMTGIEYFINLTQLKFTYNQVSSIDLSSNTKLLLLYCDNNQLTQLDLSSNTDLYNLSCFQNNITSLDLSNNINLGKLQCSSNNIDSLNLSANINLTKILCNSNSLHYLNVANGNNSSIPWIDFDAQWNPNLTCVQVDDTVYSNLNWNNRIDLHCTYSLNCSQNNSILTENLNQSINIYPNPFSKQTILQTNTPLHNATFTLVNFFGQVVLEIKNINGQTIVLSLDNLADGLYFAQLTEYNRIIARTKLIKVD